MGFREALNNQGPATKAAIIAGFAVVVGIVIWFTAHGGKPPNATQAYYTSDDGQTTFVDDFFRPYPFDHNGKPAYRVYMYQTSKGKQFVGYLERYNDAGLQALQPLLSQNMNQEQRRDAIQGVRSRYTEVKKPNDATAKWYRAGSGQAERLTSPKSPDGPDDNCILIFP